ncbi:prephenate dehydrogenase [Acetivibrio mesophilus]|uniref:Prephenate dehydrogenase n=1 Tax=Acetivibrio mesophilus TaxID=2487273 RepID=A0A4Q0I461_9FIRM|nr:prephenate dehydrogenase [Acetivibrio mesophilus]ODM26578.1 prephenate dehydrogenase [Clostridium sp. Bc-iso-3]RXE58567.1 prephenate dehydrogenase [Acetivibrio mesophilus]HHV29747.1 prephenate dehydrogenase [Clostridium sp.]
MQAKKISIIGLGLIGGSLARALKERLNISSITAVDSNEKSLSQALKEGYINEGFTELNDSVYNSDIIFICTPIRITLEYITQLHGKVKPGCILTDTASTKGEIIDYINSLDNPPCFIGGHPMAGTEKAGFASSFSHLFENAYYIMSPSKNCSEESLESLSEMIKGIGAIPVKLDSKEHDIITATISHVPHVIASALVNLVKFSDSPDRKMQILAAGGFKDITRIASSNPTMWENIILSNGQIVKSTLNKFTETINAFIEYIDNENSNSIYNFFESAKKFRDSIPSNRKGLIEPQNELIVDVVDKPGIIGEIATILGNNGINIKNINVSNSREFEQGCLRITLPDSSSVADAFELLLGKGYKVFKI